MSYWVYILCSRRNGTLYVGVTSNINRRVFDHRHESADTFVSRHGVTRLVYVEEYPTVMEAIWREKCLKRWKREWKLRLIETVNPQWKDLFGM